jgi:hypothetical protein
MCDLIAMASLAISPASGVAGYAGQVQQAKAQNQYYKENAENANRSAMNQYTAMQQRMIQEEKAAGEDKIEVARDARAARATATMAAGEANVGGLSVQGLMQEFLGREGSFNASTDRQTGWNRAQGQLELKGIKYGAQDRINSVQRASKPSFFDAGLRIAGGGLDAYSGYKQRQQRDAAALNGG